MTNTNKMMRIGVIVAVIALISMVGIAGTFAKYVTTGNPAEDAARVAKWGVTVTPKTGANINLFDQTYKIGDTVVATSENKILAPGTSKESTLGEMFTLAGTPEVRTKVSLKPTITFSGNWNDSGNAGYFPIKFTITPPSGTAKVIDCATSGKTTIADLNAWLTEQIGDSMYQIYDAGTDLSGATFLTSSKFKWEWELNGPSTTGAYQTDARDTALGNNATGSEAPTITVSYTVTAEQTQEAS